MRILNCHIQPVISLAFYCCLFLFPLPLSAQVGEITAVSIPTGDAPNFTLKPYRTDNSTVTANTIWFPDNPSNTAWLVNFAIKNNDSSKKNFIFRVNNEVAGDGWNWYDTAGGPFSNEEQFSIGGNSSYISQWGADPSSTAPNKTYEFELLEDVIGPSNPSLQKITISSRLDTTAPTVPTISGLSQVNQNSQQITWSVSTDIKSGLHGYKVFRDGEQIATTTQNSYTDTGLTQGVIYSYTVRSLDRVGNTSSDSASVSGPQDETLVTITGISADRTQALPNESIDFDIETRNDGTNGGIVYIGVTVFEPNGDTCNLKWKTYDYPDAGSRKTFTFSYTNGGALGSYGVRARAWRTELEGPANGQCQPEGNLENPHGDGLQVDNLFTVAAAAPNITITDFRASNTNVAQGDQVTISVDTQNDGTSGGTAHIGVTIFEPDGTLCNLVWQTHNYPEVGSDHTFQFTYTALGTIGEYDVSARAWSTQLEEPDEGQCQPDGKLEDPHNSGRRENGLFSVQNTSTPGLTIITHGYQPTPTFLWDSPPNWAYHMAEAIFHRVSSRVSDYGTLLINDQELGLLRPPTNSELNHADIEHQNSNRSNEEIILVFDWSEESDIPGPGRLEAGADALFALLASPLPDNSEWGELAGIRLLDRAPNIHFIGHSRGAILNTLVTDRIQKYFPSLEIGQVTSLDPHPADAFGLMRDPGYLDQRYHTCPNVIFADNYYRQDGVYETPSVLNALTDALSLGLCFISPQFQSLGFLSCLLSPLDRLEFYSSFDGVDIEGAYNHQLPEAALNNDGYKINKEGKNSGQEHSDVHLWYHGTIDLGGDASDGEADITENIRDTWYLDRGRTEGYRLSRLAGGDNLRNDEDYLGSVELRYEPQASYREPAPSPFNGNFRYNKAGWNFQGGQFNAVLGSIGEERYARLGLFTGGLLFQRLQHNVIYIPPSANALTFDVRVTGPALFPSVTGNLHVFFSPISGEGVYTESRTIGEGGFRRLTSPIPIPNQCRGSSCLFGVEVIDPQLDVAIDVKNFRLLYEAPRIALYEEGVEIIDFERPIDLGYSVFGGEDPSTSIMIKNDGGEALTVDSIDIPDPFRIDNSGAVPPFNVLSGGEATVICAMDTTVVGRFYGGFTISSNDSQTPTVSLELTGEVVAPQDPPRLSVLTNELVIENGQGIPVILDPVVQGSDPIEFEVTIQNAGGSDLEVSDISVDGPFYLTDRFSGNLGPGGVDNFLIGIIPTMLGPQMGDVEILTNDPSNGLFQFQVYVFVQEDATPTPTNTPTDTPTPTHVPGTGTDCDSGYYLLDSFGGRHKAGHPQEIAGPVYFGTDIARDMEKANCTFNDLTKKDLVVLDGFGATHFINAGCQVSQEFYFPGTSEFPEGRAVDLAVTSDSQGFWVLSNNGAIFRAGSALPSGSPAKVENNTLDEILGKDVPVMTRIDTPTIPYQYIRDPASLNYDPPSDGCMDSLRCTGQASLSAVALLTLDFGGNNEAEAYIVLDSMGGHYQLNPDGSPIPAGSYVGYNGNELERLAAPTGYDWPFFPTLDIVRDAELLQTAEGAGVVILDGWGGIHPVPVNVEDNPVYFAKNRISETDDTPIQSTGIPYYPFGADLLLESYGQNVYNDPNIVENLLGGFQSNELADDAESIFIDLEFSSCQQGFYILDRFGAVYAFGDARKSDDNLIAFENQPYFFPFLLARDIEIFGPDEADTNFSLLYSVK